MRTLALALAVVVSFGLSACASGGGGSGSTSNRSVVTAEELADLQTMDCYQALRRLRPRWIQGRGGAEPPVVFVDGARLGDPTTLRGISVGDVAEIRFLDASSATMRFGTGYTGGAILVSTRSG